MTDTKISALPASTTPLAGTEVLPIVQSGATVKVAVSNLTAGRPVSTGLLTVGAASNGDAVQLVGRASDGFAWVTYRNAANTATNAEFGINTTDQIFYGYVGGNEVYTITGSSRDIKFSAGNLVIGTSGKGIDFSATASGSGTMTSELLNDYEEGTWTPTISGSTSAGTGTYAASKGTYTKIGNLVTATAYVNITNHTGTGNILLSGLPFTAYATSDFYFPATIGYLNNCALSANQIPLGFVAFNTTSVALQQVPVGGGSMSAVPMDTAFSIMYTVSYRVA